jgi:hypothetical protein
MARIRGEITDDECYIILHENLNNAILTVHHMDGALLTETWAALRKDSELATWVKKRVVLLEQCPDPVVQKIRKEMRVLTGWGVAVGAAGLCAHLIPLLFIAAFLAGIRELVKDFLSFPGSKVVDFVSDRHGRNNAGRRDGLLRA